MLKKTRVPSLALGLCLLCAWLVTVASGCAGPKAFADWERGADFSSGKSFAVTRSDQLPEVLNERQRRAVTLVNSTIERELTHKGYTKAPIASAQLLVNFYVAQRPRQEVIVRDRECYARDQGELPPGIPWQNATIACEESQITETVEGTLIIDVYDAGDKQLIWHGWISVRVPPEGSLEAPALLQQATSDLLARFPPG